VGTRFANKAPIRFAISPMNQTIRNASDIPSALPDL
jgi:hypothetical protein